MVARMIRMSGSGLNRAAVRAMVLRMRRLALLVLVLSLCAVGRAEMFRPPVAGGRGSHRHPSPALARDHGHFSGGPWHGSRAGARFGWRGRDGFHRSRTRVFIGFGPDSFYDDWYGWPGWYGWDDWPAYGPAPVIYLPAPVAVAVPVSRTVAIQGGAGLRDARSPEQLRAIFGEQGEALIRRE
jgi:hypothetical protein